MIGSNNRQEARDIQLWQIWNGEGERQRTFSRGRLPCADLFSFLLLRMVVVEIFDGQMGVVLVH